MKITLHQKPEESYTILEKGGAASFGSSLKGFVVTIKYDANGLMLTTGTSFSTFVMDKTPDLLWDQAFRSFLSKRDISFEDIG